MQLFKSSARILVAVALPVAALAAACDGTTDAGDAATQEGGLVAEGSPDALGLLSFLNSPSTTATLLDVQVALDSRAANALIAHRDGPDKKLGTRDDNRFDTVAEVDAVSYIGTAAMNKLVTYVRANGFVPEGDDVLGTYDNVVFTVAEGTATLALANTATSAHLDADLHLDSRAVKNIVAARPIASVAALAKLPYVGTTALRILKQAATAPATPAGPTGVDVAAHLAAASNGLLFTSESDYPFTVVRIPGAGSAPLTAANIKTVIAGVYTNRPEEATLDQRDVEVVTLTSVFDNYTVPQDWWEDSQRQQAPAWTALEQVFQKELVDVQVFRIGERHDRWLEGSIDVFILGRTSDGEVVGLSTISVET